MTDLEPLTWALRLIGQDPAQVLGLETGHLVAYGHDLISRADVPGLTMDVASAADGIRARIQVERGARIPRPVHLCFGLFQRRGIQNIDLELRLEAGSCATFWSHCLFSQVEHARHSMNALVKIEEGAHLTYQEAHYHGASGGIEVTPRANIRLGPRARYRSDFSLVQGQVGRLDIDYEVDVGAEAVAELTSKVYGHGNDHIRIREAVRLNGERAHGLIRSRIAADGDSWAQVLGVTEGNAAYTRGHVDCLEIVRERAQVSALPEVRVTHALAKVTHEAAIGSVDHRQLETLMSRGVAPEEAVDIIVRGMPR
ncbi:MAG: SufD family Fe-S cluster assembly protein [Chromatiaceae bacterium]|nr:SufD family Fe-S cluster assembly protein [Chromatiaceae bacterium]